MKQLVLGLSPLRKSLFTSAPSSYHPCQRQWADTDSANALGVAVPRLKKKYMQPLDPAPAVVPEPSTIEPEIYDVKKAAFFLSATVTSTRRWLKKNSVPAVKIGRRETYRRADIIAAWDRAAV